MKGKVDESDIGKVYLGQPARITVESFKDQKFWGKVTKIVSHGRGEGQRHHLRGAGLDLERIPQAARDYDRERRDHPGREEGVIAMPEGAIIYKKDRSTEVEIPDPTSEKGKRRIAVATGISNGSKTEIVKGLVEGQQVILQ